MIHYASHLFFPKSRNLQRSTLERERDASRFKHRPFCIVLTDSMPRARVRLDLFAARDVLRRDKDATCNRRQPSLRSSSTLCLISDIKFLRHIDTSCFDNESADSHPLPNYQTMTFLQRELSHDKDVRLTCPRYISKSRKPMT